jgi:ribosomal protein S1
MIWLFIKKYWSLFLFAVLFVASSVLFASKQKQIQNLLKMLQDQTQQHNRDLLELQRIRDEEIKQRQEVQQQYEEVIAKINREHAEALVNLNRQKENEMKKLIEEFQDDPDRMAAEVNRLLGIPIQR